MSKLTDWQCHLVLLEQKRFAIGLTEFYFVFFGLSTLIVLLWTWLGVIRKSICLSVSMPACNVLFPFDWRDLFWCVWLSGGLPNVLVADRQQFALVCLSVCLFSLSASVWHQWFMISTIIIIRGLQKKVSFPFQLCRCCWCNQVTRFSRWFCI